MKTSKKNQVTHFDRAMGALANLEAKVDPILFASYEDEERGMGLGGFAAGTGVAGTAAGAGLYARGRRAAHTGGSGVLGEMRGGAQALRGDAARLGAKAGAAGGDIMARLRALAEKSKGLFRK